MGETMKQSMHVICLAIVILLGAVGCLFAQSAIALRPEIQEILSAPLSQTERDVKLWDWFEQQFAQGATFSEADKELYLQLQSHGADLRGRDDLDNQGGPDAFQYTFMDNVAPDNVTYNWIELRGDMSSTWLRGLTDFTNIDDGYSRQKLPIGFSFPFYGAVYDCVEVACNGFLQFTTISGSTSNACLPSTAVGGPMIAVFWDDLHLLYGGRTDTVVIGYRNFGEYFVIEFDGIGFYTLACRNVLLKFEAILYPNGNIKLQYDSIPIPAACANSQSIGIQQTGAAGSAALNYVCNTTGIQPANGRAILFARATGVPNAVTNLSAQYVEPNVVLTWTDPTQDTQGNPIIIDNVQVWATAVDSGTLLATVPAGVQTYTELNPPMGTRRYFVRAFRSPYYGAAVSRTVIAGTPGYWSDFETDNGGWVADPANGWEWGIPTYVSGPTAFSGTKVWGTVLASTYPPSACFRLTSTPNMLVNSPDARVEFWRWYYTEQAYDGVNFKVSTDGGINWTLVQPVGNYPYTASTANVCIPGEPYWAGISQTWTQITIPLGQFLGQMPMLRFTFGSDPSVEYAGFYLDDLAIWGVGQVSGFPRPPTNFGGSYALGNVTLTWTDPTLDINDQPMTVDSIQVWLGQVITGTRLGSVDPGVQTYVHVTALQGLQTYSIRAYNVGYASAPVSASVDIPTGPPAPVNDLAAIKDEGGVRLSWSPTNLAVGYRVYRLANAQQEYTSGELLTPTPVTETTYLDTTALGQSAHYFFYQVIAVR
jgi:hypothetical protein